MDTRTALKIIAGVINKDNVQWESIGYDSYKVNASGMPDWDRVKLDAVDVIVDRIAELEEKLEGMKNE